MKGVLKVPVKVEIDTLKKDIASVSDMISDAWSADKSYAVGDYCIYQDALWQCAVAVSGEEYAPKDDSTEWVKTTVTKAIHPIEMEFGTVNNGAVSDTTRRTISIVFEKSHSATPKTIMISYETYASFYGALRIAEATKSATGFNVSYTPLEIGNGKGVLKIHWIALW